jgi:hypothetical protein
MDAHLGSLAGFRGFRWPTNSAASVSCASKAAGGQWFLVNGGTGYVIGSLEQVRGFVRKIDELNEVRT